MLKIFRMLTMVLVVMFVSSSALAAELRIGDEGAEVTEIQGQLIELGYDVLADGEFGPAMADAIKSFQALHGIKSNGIVDSKTYEALLGRDMPDNIGSSSAIVHRILTGAMQYMGVPYIFGGSTPYGFDCSGYVQYVFAQAGISIPRTADVQFEVGTPVSTEELLPGDLVFFETYTYGASHVGIYVGDGDFIHASSSGGVKISSLGSSYYKTHYIGSRRIV